MNEHLILLGRALEVLKKKGVELRADGHFYDCSGGSSGIPVGAGRVDDVLRAEIPEWKDRRELASLLFYT